MATTLQVFLVTLAMGSLIGGFGIYLAITSQRETKDR